MAGAVVGLVVTVRFVEMDAGVTSSGVSPKDPEQSLGRPLTVSATRPANPPFGVTVTV